MAQSSSRSDLMDEYHRLAADTLLGAGSNKVAVAILQATENGDIERLQKLLAEHRNLVDARHPDSGDTPLITAARNGNKEVVDILLRCGADVTLDNDNEENALDVAPSRLRSHILKSVGHEDRSMSNAKALLQSAWLGDAVQSGSHYLDVNSRNSDGLTPLLLVTRDVSFFSQVQSAMEKEYNPVEVLEELLNNHADVKQADKQGCGPLHMIASSGPSIHATKMVSLLLQHGSDTESLSSSHQSPLHVASTRGHLTVIVALVEEGGADVNRQTFDTGDTPLMLSVRGGHNEAARYLLSRGADVTMMNDRGDSALSVANSPRMKRMIKEAWTEQTSTIKESSDNERGSEASSPEPEMKQGSCFLTDRQISCSLDLDTHNLIGDSVSGEASPVVPDSPRLRLSGVRSEQGSQEVIGGGEGVGEEVVSEGEEREKSRTNEKMRRRVMSETVLASNQQRGKGTGKKGLSSTHPMVTSKEKALSQDSLQPKSNSKTKSTLKKTTFRTGGSTGRKKTSSRSQPQQIRSSSQDRPPTRAIPSQLPPVYTYTSPPTPKPSSRSPEKLPNLNLSGMTALKVVTVDTKRENFRIRQISRSKTPAKTGNDSPSLHRSQSLLTQASHVNEQKKLGQKRNSTGSLQQFSPPDSKNVLQPNVVAPRLPSPQTYQPTLTRQPASYPNFHPRQTSTHSARKKLQSTPSLQSTQSLQSKGNKINITFPSTQQEIPPLTSTQSQLSPPQPSKLSSYQSLQSPSQPLSYSMQPSPSPPSHPPGQLPTHPPVVHHTLSIVPELSESFSSSVNLASTPGSGESTLKATSQSEFETDTLEQKHTPSQPTPTVNLAPQAARPHPTTLSPMSALPPTVDQFYQLTRQPSNSSPISSNVITHYAVPDGSAPLSPIWNMDLPQSGEPSSAGSGSDYITSVIGALATSPSALPGLRSNPGLDSGHSTDDERVREEEGDVWSSGSSSETEPVVSLDSTRSLQWKRGKLLGKGAFGKVWEGLLDSAQMIAVKEVELDITGQKTQSQYEKLKLEVEILRSVSHKNVVKYLGTSMDEDHVYIFMELIPGGSLLSIIKRFGALSIKTCSHYTRQIAQALKYLHSNSIVHRDIKGANLMVMPKGVIKLIDFGSAKQNVVGDLYLNSVRGTPYWMAPEVIKGEGHGRKSDVWSLGCTVYEMATTKPPWSDMPPEAAIFQIGTKATVPPLPANFPSEMTSFIHRCVTKEAEQRPEAAQLLDDPFLTKFRKRHRHRNS